MIFLIIYLIIGIVLGVLLKCDIIQFLMCLIGWPVLVVIFVHIVVNEVIHDYKWRNDGNKNR